MNKEFISYEQALALKELGFDEPCLAWYVSKEYGLEIGKVIQTDLIKDAIVAPTYSAAFRFFREKELYCDIRTECTQLDGSIGFSWWIWKPWVIEEWSPENNGVDAWSYETYEEAESACLDKLIEIVKNK